MRVPDHADIIGQDEAKEMLGFKTATSNSNRWMNELVKDGKIKAFQPSPKVKLYSKKSILEYIMSTRILSMAEFASTLRKKKSHEEN